MQKSGRGCQTRNNISHQILATGSDQSRNAHTITIGAFEAFATFARLHVLTLRMVTGQRVKWQRRRRLRENRPSHQSRDLLPQDRSGH